MTAIHDAAKANMQSLVNAGVKGTFDEPPGTNDHLPVAGGAGMRNAPGMPASRVASFAA